MKTPGEAAMDLRWLAPGVASLTMLARTPLVSAWTQIRTDPGVVLLHARLLDSCKSPHLLDAAVLEAVLAHQANFDHGFVDWSQPGPAAVQRACHRQAMLATRLAETVGADPLHAWIAAFLAPLGWLALSALAPAKIGDALECVRTGANPVVWQPEVWGCDHAAIARRLSRAWRLPVWLSAIVGHLGLHASIAQRLGAERQLFQVVQMSVLLTQERDGGLGLSIDADVNDLLAELKLSKETVEAITTEALQAELPAGKWESPARCPLLGDLLQIALENRRQDDSAWIEHLQQNLDRMQAALVQQCAEEKERLQTLKLSALAEFAAGAGHEINNPLAVMSGQAQYVLKQIDCLDVPADEIDNLGEYLDNLRSSIKPSLHKIIGQTQRVHTILIELMQFARPQPPKLQTLSARSVTLEVAYALQALAQQRKVRVVLLEWAHDEYLHADVGQVRTALTALLRNAIEAAPADGWAGIRIAKTGKQSLDFIVEDSGTGPCQSAREHQFDPFFSGRSAGRGRGMGLPLAWRLTRQQGGDVRFDGHHAGVTRYILTLPLAATPSYGSGPHAETKIRHVSHARHEGHL
ncbi:MAG: HDOD domain-containing protein [Gemmataceae bacterium]|nr:HDOD domain-containing protein [Gemmataceae bacterium]